VASEISDLVPYYGVGALTDEAAQLRASAAVLTGFYLALSSVGLLVGLVFLTLVLLRRVESERRTIGIQRAIGVPASQLALGWLRQSLTLGAAGAAGGLLAGGACVAVLARYGQGAAATAAQLAVFDPSVLLPLARHPRPRRPRGPGGDAGGPARADHGGAPVTAVPPRLQLEAIAKRFKPGRPEEVRALDGIDLDISPGDFVSIEGPSGCGKTTLLNLLGLLDVPTSGRILWDGRPVQARTEGERTRLRLEGVGFIFQRFYLVPTMTALENVELPLRAARRPPLERRRVASGLLSDVGLSARAGSFPHELSGGEEQRVAIARALANEPGLLLADEPTGELDTAHTDGILDLIASLQRRRHVTTVLVTHNPRVAARAHRHLTMQDGRIVRDITGPTEA
jgi:ABC-type lipoprotein export system ATPase subunit